MQSDEFNQRLSRLSTQWNAVIEAHQDAPQAAQRRADLLQRYAASVYRYLLGAVRDPDVAQDLSQEFLVRFLRGDFHRATPERGRFRDYLKTALIHLVHDHFRAQKDRPVALQAGVPEPAQWESDSAQDFASYWREELLERTWTALQQANATYYAALRLKVDHPDMPASEMAQSLRSESGKPMTGETFRKTLQRARTKFADLLVDEVQRSLGTPDTVDLEAELNELDLLRYCRAALDRRR